MRWKPKSKDRAVKPQQVHRLEGVRFKKKGDLTSFAAQHPGALSGFFLAGVYAKACKGVMVNRSKQLRAANVMAWVEKAGLKEVRDIREVMTLASIMDSVNRDELATAMDIIAQRILAIQAAKRQGGSWEKAELMELTPASSSGMAPSGMLALTS